MPLSLKDLYDSLADDGVGIRARTELEPLGGPGDKLAPPTYGADSGFPTKYATEQRRVDGQNVPSVVLDSVASQANRLELALLEAVHNGDMELPLISADFRDVEGLASYDRISSLEAPHRVFDAILRDSKLGERLFRLSDVGQSITEATTKSAAAMFRYSPTTLLFGGWDSTGPKGGRGAKYERVLTSEIVGIGIAQGVRTSSRIDPVGIELKAGTLYESKDSDFPWTLDEGEAVSDKGKPVLIKGTGDGAAGRPSQVNHGNIAPSREKDAGGVTVDTIQATTVLSFGQLRRLRFPVDGAGASLDGDRRRTAEVAARTALTALGLAAVVLAFEDGFDLRSRCVLIATAPLSFEMLRRGGQSSTFSLSRAEALDLLQKAVAGAAEAGLPWEREEILLQPAERLAELIRRSQRLAAQQSETG